MTRGEALSRAALTDNESATARCNAGSDGEQGYLRDMNAEGSPGKIFLPGRLHIYRYYQSGTTLENFANSPNALRAVVS